MLKISKVHRKKIRAQSVGNMGGNNDLYYQMDHYCFYIAENIVSSGVMIKFMNEGALSNASRS